MDDSKKEPITLSGNQESKLCLNCGFPNRNTDSHCMYCRTSLIEDAGLINWVRLTYYILRWRWQLKQNRGEIEKSESKTPFYRTGAYFFLGLLSETRVKPCQRVTAGVARRTRNPRSHQNQISPELSIPR